MEGKTLGMGFWDDWEPVRRAGDPELQSSGTRFKVQLWTKGIGPTHPDWNGYFKSKITQAGLDAVYDGGFQPFQQYRISGSCSQDDLEQYVEKIDSAVDYANSKFKADILPALISEGSQKGQAQEATTPSQADLDERARKLELFWRQGSPSPDSGGGS
jgi:hypothetical protein